MKTMCKRLLAAALAAVLVLTVLPVTSVEAAAKPKLSKTTKTLYEGDKTTLTVKNVPKKAKLTWKSTKKSVATVSKKGVVKAVKAGSAKITCKVVSGKKTYTLTCKVTVKKLTADQKMVNNLAKALANGYYNGIAVTRVDDENILKTAFEQAVQEVLDAYTDKDKVTFTVSDFTVSPSTSLDSDWNEVIMYDQAFAEAKITVKLKSDESVKATAKLSDRVTFANKTEEYGGKYRADCGIVDKWINRIAEGISEDYTLPSSADLEYCVLSWQYGWIDENGKVQGTSKYVTLDTSGDRPVLRVTGQPSAKGGDQKISLFAYTDADYDGDGIADEGLAELCYTITIKCKEN